MLIWRGFGIAVVVIAIVSLVATLVGAEAVWGAPLPKDKLGLAEAIGMLLAAALVYGLHRVLEKRSPARTVVDKETGEEMVLKSRHDLFFIPVKYWTYLFAALAVLFLFQR